MREKWRIPGFRASVLGIAIVLGVVSGWARDGDDLPFPLNSTGDLWYQVDHAGFRDGDGTPYQEFYFKINNNELKFEKEKDRWQGQVEIEIELYNQAEEKIGASKHAFDFHVSSEDLATSADHSQILLIREEVDPRSTEIHIKMMDRRAKKRGLIYLISGKRREGRTQGEFLHPASLSKKGLSLSDIQFAWSITRQTEGAPFLKNGLNVIPNPARMYGLHRGDLSAYYEVYDPDNAVSSLYTLEQWAVSAEDSSVYYRDVDTVSVRGERWVRVVRFSVQDWPTGKYTLRCRVQNLLDEKDEVSTTQSFNVVWGFAGWEVSEADQLHEAKVYLPDKEYRRFKKLSSGDREIFLIRWWRKYDPTPESPENELYREFRRRVRIADERYSAFGRRGIMTDRGRIFVRFGQPDEINSELFPTRVQLDDFAAGVEGQAQSTDLSRNAPVDTRPFEVWSYTQRGELLFPDLETFISPTGLDLVFVDETGTGHWVLRFQSQDINY